MARIWDRIFGRSKVTYNLFANVFFLKLTSYTELGDKRDSNVINSSKKCHPEKSQMWLYLLAHILAHILLKSWCRLPLALQYSKGLRAWEMGDSELFYFVICCLSTFSNHKHISKLWRKKHGHLICHKNQINLYFSHCK